MTGAALLQLIGGVRAAVFALLALLLAIALGLQVLANHDIRSGWDKDKLAWAEQTAEQAQAVIEAQQAARAKEQASQAQLTAIAAKFEQEKANAQAEQARVVADLESGAVRLRQQWRGCQATANLSGAAASGAQPDPADRLRAASVGRVLGAVRELQAQRDALIDVVEADRK